ncbi:hypothetical protein BP5796_03442 [Coleophoma crateriformis]|uniref:Extracellular membrane protein CFEM domain-containing protein n=1 Tax=Coleophoma crateriformis TaxID=565419 RepID=A0A3D8SPM5_9HELO|nr:hypothetical protein BP5796_03442 [Coleophoma crateriformis]
MALLRKNMRASILCLVGGASMVLAGVQNYNPTGQGCLDPDGFLSCYAKQVDLVTSCATGCTASNVAGSQALKTCLTGCNGAQLAGNLGCWVQSCWNQLYSCENQLATISYFDGNDLIQNPNIFPWFPPPSDAVDGACSCNLGYVEGNKTIFLATPNFNQPCENVASRGNPAATAECACCEFSFPVSNILNICPTSDLSVLGMSAYIEHTQGLISASGDACAILNDGNQDSCLNTYGYRFRGDKVFNPLSLPSGIPGSDPLTNNPGNAFTDFGASAYTLNLFPGFSSTITPVPFNAKAGAATGTVSAAAVATGTESATQIATGTVARGSSAAGTATSSATGTAAATTSKSAAGGRNGVNEGLALAAVMLLASYNMFSNL